MVIFIIFGLLPKVNIHDGDETKYSNLKEFVF